MGETLYRKYRPQTFESIHGQEGITTTLTNQIKLGRIAHAYIFAGTRGTGKTTTARVFAKAINCRNRAADSAEPCGVCSSCADITSGRSVDVIELDAATHTGVDIVREQIIENARMLPTRDPYKIFIIDEVHMLSTSSFNALLKSLEEPPAHVVYILATTELHKIPTTVASRCQRFIFHPLSLDVMEKKLTDIALKESVEVDASVIRRVLSVSGGAMRDAESLLGQLLSLGGAHITDTDADLLLPPTLLQESLSFIETLVQGSAEKAFAHIEQLFESGVDLPSLHDALTRHAHELLVVRATKDLPIFLGIFSDADSALIKKYAETTTSAWLGNFIDQLLAKKLLYKTVSSPFIPLHLVVTALTSPYTEKPRAPVSSQTPIARAPAIIVPPVASALPPTPQNTHFITSITDEARAEDSGAAAARVPQQSQTVPGSEINATEIVVTPSEPVQPRVTLTLDDVRGHWVQTTQHITSEMPSLGIILSSTQLCDIQAGVLQLGVQFPMYREKLLDLKVKNKIENVLERFSGSPLRYTIVDWETAAAAPQEPEVTDILEAFGGRVVA